MNGASEVNSDDHSCSKRFSSTTRKILSNTYLNQKQLQEKILRKIYLELEGVQETEIQKKCSKSLQRNKILSDKLITKKSLTSSSSRTSCNTGSSAVVSAAPKSANFEALNSPICCPSQTMSLIKYYNNNNNHYVIASTTTSKKYSCQQFTCPSDLD
jgi:hypothetical protein